MRTLFNEGYLPLLKPERKQIAIITPVQKRLSRIFSLTLEMRE